MTAHDAGDGPWPYFCVDAEHIGPWPCRNEWIIEPDFGMFKIFTCDDHGPVAMNAVVALR